jgi:hypothetical protein
MQDALSKVALAAPGWGAVFTPGTWAFVTLAINPVGGLLVAIPFAILRLGYPPWLTVIAGAPLAYVQVLVVDLGWTYLARISAWHRFLERRRSPRVERLVAAGGRFWLTLVLAPLLGPWLVMAFMRYAQVPQRRVAAPILLGLLGVATGIALLCVFVPRLFDR